MFGLAPHWTRIFSSWETHGLSGYTILPRAHYSIFAGRSRKKVQGQHIMLPLQPPCATAQAYGNNMVWKSKLYFFYQHPTNNYVYIIYKQLKINVCNFSQYILYSCKELFLFWTTVDENLNFFLIKHYYTDRSNRIIIVISCLQRNVQRYVSTSILTILSSTHRRGTI